MQKLDKTLEFCQSNILRVFRTLGLHEINATQIRSLIAQTSPDQRERIMPLLQHLKTLKNTNQKSLKMRAELESRSSESIKKGEIRILGTAFTDTEVRMGEEKLILREDLEHHSFHLSSQGVQAQPTK